MARLHYLTQDMPSFSHIEQVRMACEAGMPWIQLRIKKKSFDECLLIAQEARIITHACNCTLIINDDVNIAGESGADGVHLGRDDMHWKEARDKLGAAAIIGVSTHSWNELNGFGDAEVNYAGLGPLRFTSTKEKLDPVLGISGIREVMSIKRAFNPHLPVIAIGGITLNDVQDLLMTGANGIAVSSAINKSANPAAAAKAFLQRANSSLIKTEIAV